MPQFSDHDPPSIDNATQESAVWPTPQVAALFDKHFSSSENSLLARSFKKTAFAAGEILWHEGEPAGDRMLLISAGYVKLSSRRPDFHMPIVHAVLGPPSVFGVETLFLDEPSIYTAQCVTDIEALFMQRSAFEHISHAQPILSNRFMQKLFSLCLHRQRATCQRLMAFF